MPPPMEPARTSRNRESEPGPAIVREAAEWLAQMESGDASDADHADLAAWRTADPAHAVALDRLAVLQDNLDGATQVEQETLRRLLLRPARRTGASIAGAVALIGFGWMASGLAPVQLYFADQKTAVAETRVIALPDGSKLTLSTDSAVNIDVSADQRVVHLLRGELLVNVARAMPSRFEVVTEDGTATALGTAYTVQKEAESTAVAVAESQVRICPAVGGEAACMILTPRQKGRLTRDGVKRMPDIAAADVGAWADGWLSINDRPLVDVLDELNHWRTKPIGFDRRDLAGLRVSGIFPLNNTDKAAANLTRLLPIVMDNRDPAAPVIHRR